MSGDKPTASIWTFVVQGKQSLVQTVIFISTVLSIGFYHSKCSSVVRAFARGAMG